MCSILYPTLLTTELDILVVLLKTKMNAVGRAMAFVYHVETGLFTVRNLFNERLQMDAIDEGTVIFVEARNVK